LKDNVALSLSAFCNLSSPLTSSLAIIAEPHLQKRLAYY
jgi:hypothetical protein